MLDLTLTNIGERITCKVVPGVSDHMMILCKMMLPLFSDSGVYRECYQYNKANWSKLNHLFENTDWLSMFIDVDVATTIQRFPDYVIQLSKQCIPFEKKIIRKSCHPWLNETCKKLVSEKHVAYGTPAYASARIHCSNELFFEYSQYASTTKKWLGSTVGKQKDWWEYAKPLVSRGNTDTIIPAL